MIPISCVIFSLLSDSQQHLNGSLDYLFSAGIAKILLIFSSRLHELFSTKDLRFDLHGLGQASSLEVKEALSQLS